MLFETNTKGHKHPSIRLFIIEQDTVGKPKKAESGIEPRNRPPTPEQSYRLWCGATSPILNDTPCVCMYTSYNQNSYKECIRINKCRHINIELLDGNKGHQAETHHPTHSFWRLFLDLLSIGWRGWASALGAQISYASVRGCWQTSHCWTSIRFLYVTFNVLIL